MNGIINVAQKQVGTQEIQTVNARELHSYLGVGKDFSNWMKDRIDAYGFSEGLDYTLTIAKTGVRSNVIQKDYYVSLDMAKELSMVDRGVKGKECRKYFIQCEKTLQNTNVITLPNFNDPAEAAIAWAAQYKEKQVAQLELAGVKLVVAENEPKVAFYDAVVKSEDVHSLAEAAKLLGTGRTRFSAFLKANGYMRNSREPYQNHLDSKIMDVSLNEYRDPVTGIMHRKFTPLITEKGIAHFQKKLSKASAENTPNANTMTNCPVSVVNSTITKTSITSSLNKHNAAVQRKLKGL